MCRKGLIRGKLYKETHLQTPRRATSYMYHNLDGFLVTPKVDSFLKLDHAQFDRHDRVHLVFRHDSTSLCLNIMPCQWSQESFQKVSLGYVTHILLGGIPKQEWRKE